MMERSARCTGGDDKVKIRRSMTLMNAVAIIVGSQIGSGIFISPQGLLASTGSIGFALIIWVLCGLIAVVGGLCFAELGTLIRESGGEWAYLNAAFGAAPAFCKVFVETFAGPAGAALQVQATAQYLIGPFFDDCGPPNIIVKLLSLALLWLCMYINTSIKTVRMLMNWFFLAKVVALALIVIGGMYSLIMETGVDNLKDPFKGTTTDGFSVSFAFYAGLWSYSGWANLNEITEEITSPRTTLPAGILISNILVIILYVLVNISYFAVLTRQEMLASTAVAVDWGYHFVGAWSVIISTIVAFSCFGTAVAFMFSGTRSTMVVSRAGHTLKVLSLVSVDDNAPIASIAWRGILSAFFIFAGGVYTLLSFLSFTGWIFLGGSFIAQLRLRHMANNFDKDRFRVPIVLPIFMIFVSIYLTVIPLIADPTWFKLFALVIIGVGLALYYAFVKANRSLACFDKFTLFCQLLAKMSIPDKDLS